jgi:hypothetical protein
MLQSDHYWPDPEGQQGVVQDGLPKNWYSHSGKIPQEGGICQKCHTSYMKIKNGDIYFWSRKGDKENDGKNWFHLYQWRLFKKRASHRPTAKRIGDEWVQ